MAFQIKFYKSGNEAKLVQKTLPTPVTLLGTTKEACDIVDPVILVEYTTSGNFEFNYCYIAQWSRYYFVTKKVVEQTGLWTISMHCDVLMAYGPDIDSLQAYVARNENTFNPDLVDTRYPFENRIRTSYLAFPYEPFSVDINTDPLNPFPEEYHFVLTTATSEVPVYTATPITSIAPLQRPNASFSAYSLATMSYALRDQDVLKLVYDLLNIGTFEALIDGNKADGIVNLMVYPFMIPSTRLESVGDVYVFDQKKLNNVRGKKIPRNVPLDFDFGEIDVPGNNFTYREPFTKYQLYLPYIGFTELCAAEIEGSKLRVRYVVDLATGKCDAYIIMKRGVTAVQVIKIVSGTIGIPIPLTSTNAQEVARNIVNNGIALAGSAITLGVSASTGFGAGVIGGATGLVNAGIGLVANPTIMRGSIGSAQSAFYAPQTAKLYIMTQESDTSNLSSYATYEGRPYMAVETLSNLVGYTEIERIHLTGLTHATSGEVDELESLLKSGVIFGATPHYT